MSSFLEQLQQAQRGAGGGGGAVTSAESIRQRLESRRVGCGCLGWMIGLIFGIHWLASAQAGSSSLALTAAGVLGVVLFLAVQTRGFHLWTGVAWLGLGVLWVGGTCGVYTTVSPAEASGVLPAFLASPAGWGGIAALGLGVFGWVSWKMRGQISTEESLYAIQLHAASKQVRVEAEAPRLEAALEVLELSTRVGIFPLGAEYLNAEDRQEPPEGAAGPHLMPLLAVEIYPSPDPWTHSVGEVASLRLPEGLLAGPPTMAPRSAGILYVDGASLRYVPLRRGVPGVDVLIREIKEIKVRINGLAVRTESGEWDFAFAHAWRMAALVLFIGALEVEVTGGGASLVATGVRAGARRPEGVPSSGGKAEVRRRLGELGARGEASRALAARLERLLEDPRLPLTAVGARLVEAWGWVVSGEEPVEAEVALSEAEAWMDALPEGVVPDALTYALDELNASRLVVAGRWGEALDLVADMVAPGDGEDEARDEAWQEALVEAVKAARAGDREKVAAAVSAARQVGEAVVLEVLSSR